MSNKLVSASRMSIDTIKLHIASFLKHDQPEVMAIKGSWGVGKTYSWNKFLLEAKDRNCIALKKYSYVSLFGLNSLDSFKYSIFEQTVDTKLIDSQVSVENFKKNTLSLLESKGRGLLSTFNGMRGLSAAIHSLSFLSLKETLICIDDLERKGSSLCLKDVLGLVLFLKEQKKCKIVLLLNDSDEELSEYVKYREKVIDIELQFIPSSSECASIAFDLNDPDMVLAAEFTQKLDIRNIRILKKIERLIKLVRPLLNGFQQDVIYEVTHSLVLFSWCHYCSGNGIPTLDYVTKLGYSAWGIGEETLVDEEQKKWKSVLSNYGYQMTGELNLVLADAVRTGYFVEADVLSEASRKNQLIMASRSENSFSEAWRLYHDSFGNNKDDVIARLYDSFIANVDNITVLNLNGTVTLFRDLGEGRKASELINIFLEKRKDEKELFDLEKATFFGDERDPEIIEKFNQFHESTVCQRTATQVLSNMTEGNGWTQDDEKVLASTSADQYYDIFKSINGRHLSSYVNTCLLFGRLSNASEQQQAIGVNATAALKRIASESEINKRRIKKFGIELDNA